MQRQDPMPRPESYTKRVALVLQGGGALGSYQAGVYEALAASDYLPDWVAGISIGAINAAIIAGNAPEHRVDRLRRFWDTVTTPAAPFAALFGSGPLAEAFSAANRQMAASAALLFGQKGFFAPRPVSGWAGPPNGTSFYDTSALKGTLESLVDFDRINAREMRFSVGAVNVRTGNFAYFDNADIKIRAEHVMASGALPPGFPAVEIDGEHYWDGGLVSNTPLQHVLSTIPRRSRLTFQVDVFASRGPLPTTLDQVVEREKDVRFSSRTRAATDTLALLHDLRYNINTLWDQLPEALRATPEAQYLYGFGCVTTMDIVEIVYRPGAPLGQSKDYEFSRATMRDRWAAGRADACTTLAASPWLAPADPAHGARTFDVLFREDAGQAAGVVA